MSITPLNIGSAPNDGNGQTLRSGGQAINANFAELDTRTSAAQAKADAAIPATQKGAVNGVATLGTDAKIPAGQLPALAINEVFTVATQAAMLALTAQRGDMAVRTDQSNQAYVLAADAPSVLANWIAITQNLAAALKAIGAVVPAVDTLAYFNGTTTAASAAFTAKARALLARTDTSGMQGELGLGTAATLTATTSAVDNTAGRVVRMGDLGFGVDSNPAQYESPNIDTSAIGEWRLGSTTLGAKPFLYGQFKTWRQSSNISAQFAQSFTTDEFAYRATTTGTWSPWRYIVHSDANGNLAQKVQDNLMSSSVVSGWGIEKFASGVCIVTGFATTPSLSANSVTTVNITIPSVFINTNAVPQISILPRGSTDVTASNSFMLTTTTLSIYARNGATAQIWDLRINIVGRWK